MVRGLGAAFATLMGFLAQTADANVFYPDDRIVTKSPAAPWSYIGKLTRSGSSKYCTAALVGSARTIWTAAHCVWNFERNAPHSEQLYFVPSGGMPSVPVKRFELGTRSSRAIYYSDKDWAVLELDASVQVGGYFTLPTPATVSEHTASLAMGAFTEDRASGKYLSTQSSCRITGSLRGSGMLTHDCDSWHGSSGAPLFMPAGDQYVVILINTSQRGGSLRLARYSLRYSNVGIAVGADMIAATRKLMGAFGGSL